MMSRVPVIAGVIALLAATPVVTAQSIDYRSVARPGILFDAPSHGARPLFIVAPGTPLEVVVRSGEWVRVRDQWGDMNWLDVSALSPQRTVIVTAERAFIRSAPKPDAAIVFEASRDVVLDVLSPPQAGWAQVRHKDGLSGFIFISQAWGL